MSSPRCASSSASSVVANLVCTTDCSSAKSSPMTASAAAAATGVAGSAVISTFGTDRPAAPASSQDLGRRAGPGQHEHAVVAAARRHLRCREGVGLALAGGLARGRVRLRDEPGGTAADHRHSLAASGQHARPRSAASSAARRQQAGCEAISASVLPEGSSSAPPPGSFPRCHQLSFASVSRPFARRPCTTAVRCPRARWPPPTG